MVCRSNLPIEYSSWGDWKETSTRIAQGRDKVFQLNLTSEVVSWFEYSFLILDV